MSRSPARTCTRRPASGSRARDTVHPAGPGLPPDARRTRDDRHHQRAYARERAASGDPGRARADRARDARQPRPGAGRHPPSAARRSVPTPGASTRPDLAVGLDELADVAEEAYRDVREAILGLRESSRVGRGLFESLRAYLEKYEHQSGIDTTFETDFDTSHRLSPAGGDPVIRVIQEALTNVRKHAGAHVHDRARDKRRHRRHVPRSRTTVAASTWSKRLLDRDSGFGLHAMRERMESDRRYPDRRIRARPRDCTHRSRACAPGRGQFRRGGAPVGTVESRQAGGRSTPIRILLVDDQPLFRRAIATLIDEQPDFTVVGEAANGAGGASRRPARSSRT